MPFLPFVVLLAWQAVSKSASFALGWATAIYFGQVPGRQGRILAVASLASAAWVILLIGFAAPLLLGALLDTVGLISRNFSVFPLHVLALWAAIVLGPPAIAAAVVWAEFLDERSVARWLRLVPVSYPATASLGLGVLQMVVFTPYLIVRRLVRKHALLQVALSMRDEADDDDLVEAVRTALRSIDITEVEAERVHGVLAWPMLTVGFAARNLLGAVVRGEPMRLRANGLQLFAYATNVAVLGPSKEAHRARAALERELPFANARITWTDDARELEDAIMAAWSEDGGDPPRLHRRLEELQRSLDATSLHAEEWNLLYRLRLQVEHVAAEDAERSQPDGAGARRNGDRAGVTPQAAEVAG